MLNSSISTKHLRERQPSLSSVTAKKLEASTTRDNKGEALEIYIKTLSGKTVPDLEQNESLRDFVKEYQSKYGFHLHLKNGEELGPCDGDHQQHKVTSLHKQQEPKTKHSHEHEHAGHSHPEHNTHSENTETKTKDSHQHEHHAEDELSKGFLGKLINGIANNEAIPKAIKPLLARGTINTANIFLAQGLSLPLHHLHSPNELTNSSAIAGMHLLNYGTQKWENLAKNLITIIPFVALHRVVKVPSFIMRSALGLAISLGEQLNNGDNHKSPLDKIKESFTKDASKFLVKLAQMETMLNTAIPLGQLIAKNVPNKAVAFLSQNLAMAGAFTLIPELFKAFRKEDNKSTLDHAALSAELLECPVCGDAHAANVHLAEISEGVSIAGASNASEQDNLHSLVHHGGLH